MEQPGCLWLKVAGVIERVGVRGGRGTRVCDGRSDLLALSASLGHETHCIVP